MMNAEIVEDVLPPETLKGLHQHLSEGRFSPFDLGDGIQMFVQDIPEHVKNILIGTIEGWLDRDLEDIATYARYNSPEHDSSFRIHSDGLILGQQPDVAAVLYLTTGEAGTALFEHEEYGDFCNYGSIFTEDDGKWSIKDYCEEIANTMFIYPAKSFHSRWPHKANKDRIVVVSFLKYRGVDGS